MVSGWAPVFVFDVASQAHFLSNDREIGWIKSWPDPFYSDVIIVTPAGEKSIPFHWEHRFTGFVEFLSTCHEVFRISVVLSDGHVIFYRLDVNCTMFTWYMDNEGCIPGEMHVISLMREKIKLAQECSGSHKSYQGDGEHKTTELIQCRSWNPDVPLTKDQKTSVAWMQNVEICIRTKNNGIRYATCVPIGSTGWAYDCTTDTLTRWEDTAWLKTRFRGGVLTNPVNTGKTACALYLIKSSLDAMRDSFMEYHSGQKYIPHPQGTLIIVPQNIVGQWKNEISKFLGEENLKTIYLTEPKDLKRTSFTDMLQADVVFTTTNLLKTKVYSDLIEKLYHNMLGYDVVKGMDKKTHREPHVMQMATRKMGKTSDFFPTFPFIELVHWQRVIVDEIHEYFTGSPASRERHKCLRNLSCNAWWGLTGTPNTRTSESIQSFYFFLAPKLCDDAKNYHHHPCLQSAVKQVILRSFTSAMSEPIHHLHLITPSLNEAILLETLCNSPFEQYALNSITANLQQNLTNRLDAKSARLYIRMRRWARRWTMGATKSMGCNAFLEDQFASLINDEEPETCTVCMDRKCDTLLVACGHTYCEGCIQKVMFANLECARACPTCRIPLDGHDAVQIIPPSGTPVFSMGTKLFEVANIVVSLLARLESVVLFVQWKPAEDAVVSVLKKFGVDVLRLCGTVTTRNAVLTRFMNEPGKAIILSLDQSSSGLHLSSARHVVFVHAIAESKNTDYERQALGRLSRYGSDSPVHVHHTVLANTREYDTWIQKHPRGWNDALDNLTPPWLERRTGQPPRATNDTRLDNVEEGETANKAALEAATHENDVQMHEASTID